MALETPGRAARHQAWQQQQLAGISAGLLMPQSKRVVKIQGKNQGWLLLPTSLADLSCDGLVIDLPLWQVSLSSPSSPWHA